VPSRPGSAHRVKIPGVEIPGVEIPGVEIPGVEITGAAGAAGVAPMTVSRVIDTPKHVAVGPAKARPRIPAPHDPAVAAFPLHLE
jgi:hypothetical protein